MDPAISQNAAPPRQQLQRLAIILGVLFAILAAGYFFVLRMDYAPLFEGLKPADASAVVSELTDQGVHYRLADGGATILVESSKRDEVRLAILGSDVSSKGLVGFELFDQSEMGLTDFAQKIKYQRALQGELARSITMMEGIETARVHIAIPERAMFRGSDTGPTAAVTLSSTDGVDPVPESIEGIRQLVAASVPELLASSVVVLNEQGRILSSVGPKGVSETGPEVLGFDQTDTHETYYQQKVVAALGALMGTGRPDVILSLETDPAVLSETESEGVSLLDEAALATQLRIVVISDHAFGEAERIRIGDALSAVLSDTIFSTTNLTFLDRGASGTTPSPRTDVPVVPVLDPLLEKLGIAEVMKARSGLALAVGGGFLVLLSILVALLMSRKRKGLTPEEHHEFAQLLNLEFAPTEEPAR